MAIEPLASVMTVQAQTAVPSKAPKAPEKSNAEDTQSTTVQEVAKADKTINVVDDAKNKGNMAGSDNKEQPAKEQQANAEQIRKAVEKLNKNMQHSEAIFGIHEGTNRVMIKIVDRESKEVIKELPPEKTLDMIAKVWELAGIMIDEKR